LTCKEADELTKKFMMKHDKNKNGVIDLADDMDKAEFKKWAHCDTSDDELL